MGIYVDPNSGNYNSFYGYPGQMDAQGMYGFPGQGYGPYVNASKPGFFQGAWGLVSPFSHTPLHQTPGEENAPYYAAVGTRPVDAAAAFAQKVVVPGLAVGLAQKMLGANTGSFWGDLAAPFRGQGAAAAFGKGMGAGAASKFMSGIGFSSAGLASRGVVGAAGMAGGVAMGYGLPLVVAEGLSKVANYAVFDPYISTRRMATDLRQNMFGVSMAGAEGDITRGGKGLGAGEATRMAQNLTRAGIQDYTFNLDQYGDIANMLGKSGALDSASAKRITERVKSASEQIKLIVQISKDPSIQKAVEELSKLQLAGASLDGGRLGVAGQAYSKLGMYASAAGTTVQRLMEGVGAQGQAMYGSMGMTSYLGQLAAGNVYSGFASAYRSGLVSEGMMARMGGIDRATSTALAGGMTAGQSPLMQMMMYNTAAGRGGSAVFGGGQTPTGIMSAFGQGAARDPFSTMGLQTLMGPQMMERFMQNDSRHIEQTVIGLMRSTGVQPAGENGKYTIQQMAPFMQSYFGMNPDQIRNFANRRLAETDAATVATKSKGLQTQSYEETLQYMESQGLVNTTQARAAHAVKSAARGFRGALNTYLSEPLSSAAASLQSSVSEAVHQFQYGNTVSRAKEMTVEDLEGSAGLLKRGWTEVAPKGFHSTAGESKDLLAPYKGFNFDVNPLHNKLWAAASLGTSNAEIRTILSTIENLARTSGHPAQELAEAFMKTSNRSERASLLSDLLSKFPESFPDGAYARLFEDSDEYQEVLDTAVAIQTSEVRVRQDTGYNQRALGRSVEEVLGKTELTADEGTQAMGKVVELGEKIASKKSGINEATIDRYIDADPLLKQIVGKRRGREAYEYLQSVHSKIRGSGMGAQGVLAAQMGDVMKMDPNKIRNEAYRKKFVSAGTKAEKEKVRQSYIASVSGPGLLISPGREMSFSESAAAMAPGLAASRESTRGAEEVAGAAADYKQYRDLVLAFEKPIDKFSEGVDAFVAAVRGMPGSSVPGNVSSGDSLFDRGLKYLRVRPN